ncbi:MAG: hypothetical protein ACRD0R_07480 [Acidimicrobiales bacterium]
MHVGGSDESVAVWTGAPRNCPVWLPDWLPGPEAGLDFVDQLGASGSLDGYHLLYSVRGDLLEKLGPRKRRASSAGRRRSPLADADEG